MSIAVTGATGHLGRLAIADLKARGVTDVIALARDPAKAADLGVPVRAFDYKQAAALAPALAGVSALVLISSNDFEDRAGQHRNVITAAKAAGVGHVVYTSILGGPATPLLLGRDHITTEAALGASGLPFTILRNGWYTENYTGSLGGALAAGAMVGSAGNGRISTAARADYAAAIGAVLTTPGALGGVHELAGDSAWTLPEMAAEGSRQTGRTIPYRSLPEADYAALLQSFGLPAGFAAMLADSDAQVAKGALFNDGRALSRLIGRPTTPMAATVAEALAALATA